MFDYLQQWQAYWVRTYFKNRYGPSWLWYYLNWEQNGEFLP